MVISRMLLARMSAALNDPPRARELADVLNNLSEAVEETLPIEAGTDNQIPVYNAAGDGLEPASTGQVALVTGDTAQVRVGNVGAELSIGRVTFNGSPTNGWTNQGLSGFNAWMPGKAFPQFIFGDDTTTGSCFLDANGTTGGILNINTLSSGRETNIAHSGSTLGFFGATAVTKPTVTGSRGGNAALASLLTQLAALGLITDSTTA